MTTLLHKQRWDIFCRVIDNYGDIGVCWRLARQLANEYAFDVRLWVDELEALVAIWPSAALVDHQIVSGVTIKKWNENFDKQLPADVVIEAFACNLPDNYVAAMKNRALPPCWFNLEYLSAEPWVEGCHGLISMHPQYGLKKVFFFPGFTVKTGGLIKEQSLNLERDEFQQGERRHAFLEKLGVTAPDNGLVNRLIVSLFGYENAAIGSLIDSFIQSSKPILCLVPASKILPGINAYIGGTLGSGDVFNKGSLTLKVIPFLTQTEYDHLLWVSDINFVRGEDSFVRAQWAAKPFIWHIYPQDDDLHMTKLDAFLEIYLQNTDDILKTSITNLWHNWNRGDNSAKAWEECLQNHSAWLSHSQKWPLHLDELGDLGANIVNFSQKKM